MATRVSNRDRDKLAAALAAALLVAYKDAYAAALKALGRTDEPVTVTREAAARIESFATDRAQKVQNGINARVDAALATLPADAGEHAKAAAVQSVADGAHEHNHAVLIPFLASWAKHQSLLDAATRTIDPATGSLMRDSTLWQWVQTTDYQDDCTDADALGPARLDDIFAVTGGPPPLHENCACSLGPV
jgi:hypothetical protein